MSNEDSRAAVARRSPAPIAWQAPPSVRTRSGSERRIGLELEFSGLSVAATAEVLASRLGAALEVRSRHEVTARLPGLGPVLVALDTRHARHLAQDSAFTQQMRDLFGDAASIVVPAEITAPPQPIAKAGVLDEIAAALREAGALGTRTAPSNAFALQLNIEAAAADAGTVLDTLRAYLLLEDWLRAEIDVSVARSLLGFESRFPLGYARLVLDPAYAPDAGALIDDYVAANPTRNRGLDLLPILAEIDGGRVETALPDEKIKARPAFHYRLPDCRIDEPGWLPRDEWDRWLAIERLVADRARLHQAMTDRAALLDGFMPTVLSTRALTEASIAVRRSI